MRKPEFVGSDAIAELLQISRERVDRLTERPDFPRHVCHLSVGKLWRTDEVEAWAEKARRKTGQ